MGFSDYPASHAHFYNQRGHQVIFADRSFSGIFPTREEAAAFAKDEGEPNAEIRTA